MGLTASLYTAGQSLELFSAGIQVAGQNTLKVSITSALHYAKAQVI